jgi:hypothetical protein
MNEHSFTLSLAYPPDFIGMTAPENFFKLRTATWEGLCGLFIC